MMRSVLAIALFTAPLVAGADDNSLVVRAMKDELARSMKKLQLENLDKPYFIAYRMVETRGCSATATFGALTGSNCDPSATAPYRTMTAEVRVGDYKLDNTNFWAPMINAGVVRISPDGGVTIPIDDNYDELRRQFWLATDSAYKSALDNLAKKKAALEHRTRPKDNPDDFSREAVIDDTENEPPVQLDRKQAEDLVRSLSRVFREIPGIDNSQVRLNSTMWTTWYVNSEGTSYVRHKSLVQLHTDADTQAPDGMPLADFDVIYARSFPDLPSRDDLTKRVRAFASHLDGLRKAGLVERYSGPVLFKGEAAAEIFYQGISNALVGSPRVVVDDLRFETRFGGNAGFEDKIGSRILPDFLSLQDAPALRDFRSMPLFGGYRVDDEGVRAGETQLVDHGILQALLHSRTLIADTKQSTANRRGSNTTPSNLLFTNDRPMTDAQLRSELIRLATARHKEYGVLVRRMGNPQLSAQLNRGRVVVFANGGGGQASIRVEPVLEAVKVFADGHEEPIRNLNINGLTLESFRSIVAASEPATVYTAPVRFVNRIPLMGISFTQPGGPMVISTNIPNLLFEDLALEKPNGDVPILPFSEHPYFDKTH